MGHSLHIRGSGGGGGGLLLQFYHNDMTACGSGFAARKERIYKKYFLNKLSFRSDDNEAKIT
jgi:hypothetical protein